MKDKKPILPTPEVENDIEDEDENVDFSEFENLFFIPSDEELDIAVEAAVALDEVLSNYNY